MNIYRSSGRFINYSQMSIIHQSQDDLSLTEHRAQIPSNQYYTINPCRYIKINLSFH